METLKEKYASTRQLLQNSRDCYQTLQEERGKKMDIKEVYKDTFLVNIDKKVYEKLQDIYYFETIGKKKTMEKIQELIEKILDTTNITNITIEDTEKGYIIKYMSNYFMTRETFCYTLSEVIIHLRQFIR